MRHTSVYSVLCQCLGDSTDVYGINIRTLLFMQEISYVNIKQFLLVNVCSTHSHLYSNLLSLAILSDGIQAYTAVVGFSNGQACEAGIDLRFC